MAEALGNFIGAFAITKMSQSHFIVLMSLLMGFPSAMFIFLRNPQVPIG